MSTTYAQFQLLCFAAAIICVCIVAPVSYAKTLDTPTSPLIGTMCFPLRRNNLNQPCFDLQGDPNCVLSRKCRHVIEGVWPVTSNQRFHPEGIMTVLVKPTSVFVNPLDFCDAGRGSFIDYFNHWLFFRIVIGGCNFQEDYINDWGDPNDLRYSPALLESLWAQRTRLPARLTLPVAHNIQDIRVATDSEALRWFPNDGDADLSKRWFFLGDANGNNQDAVESSVAYDANGAFDRTKFSKPYYIQRSTFATHDTGLYSYLFNYEPICGTQAKEWHQTNHFTRADIWTSPPTGGQLNRVAEEARNLQVHNTEAYPFDDGKDVTNSYLTFTSDCVISFSEFTSGPFAFGGSICVSTKLGFASTCTGSGPVRTCETVIKIDSVYFDANILRGLCLIPTPQQPGFPLCGQVFSGLAGSSAACGCGSLASFTGFGIGLSTITRLESPPTQFSEFLTFKPLYLWEAEKFVSRSFTPQPFCSQTGTLNNVPGFGSPMFEAGLINVTSTRGFGFRQDIGNQHVGTLTIINNAPGSSTNLPLIVRGARNDDRSALVDVQWFPHNVVGGVAVNPGETRRMAVRGLDQSAAEPRPSNDRRLDTSKLPYSIPRCRWSFPWNQTAFADGTAGFENYRRAAGGIIQPRRTSLFFPNLVVGNMFVDSIPSDTWAIRTTSTIYTLGAVAENNGGSLDLKNGRFVQFRNDIKGAANRWRPFNEWDPLIDTYDNLEVSYMTPPCQCATTAEASLVPGGVVCDAADRTLFHATEFASAASEKGTYQNSPTSCSIDIPTSIDNGDGTVSLQETRFYRSQATFQPAASQNHGRRWFAWRVEGPAINTVVIGNSTSRTAFYELDTVDVQFNSPGTYVIEAAISTGITRLFLRCKKTVIVRSGCPFVYQRQSSQSITTNTTATLSAIMPDRGITESDFQWTWKVFKVLFQNAGGYGATNSPMISLRKMGNSVVTFRSAMPGRFLISLDVTGNVGATTTCRNSFLYSIIVTNASTVVSNVIDPEALFIPTICLGASSNFSDSEIASGVKPIDESSLASARFSINRNIFFTWGSTQEEDQGLSISAMMATVLGLSDVNTASTGAGGSSRIKVSVELSPDQAEASPIVEPILSVLEIAVYVIVGILAAVGAFLGCRVFIISWPWCRRKLSSTQQQRSTTNNYSGISYAPLGKPKRTKLEKL